MFELFAKFKDAFDDMAMGVVALGAISVMWVTTINLTTNSNADSIKKIDLEIQSIKLKIEADKVTAQQAFFERLTSIDNRLSRIEGSINR